MPPNTVYVGRPTKFGNPFTVNAPAAAMAAVSTGGKGNVQHDRAHGVVCLYVRWLGGLPVECGLTAMMAKKELEEAGRPAPPKISTIRHELRGKDLACFCELDQPCHADVLLELANR